MVTPAYVRGGLAALLLIVSPAAWAQTPITLPDIPASFTRPTTGFDYDKRVAMIPMRDGVKLYTVIVVPRGAKNAPIIMTRTPYNAAGRTTRSQSATMLGTLPQGDEVFVADGYIRVFQDVRGKYGSEGDYLMTRPLRGPLNPTNTDHSTDAYDTIEWLVTNVPEGNGRVGMLGSSYEGFTVVMALVNPHPALKVAAPMSPMIDGWMGDDWFHFGAFRQTNFDFFSSQTTARGGGSTIIRPGSDDYETFRRAGSAGDYARAAGLEQLPMWRKVSEHPAYDQFWQEQALDKIMAKQPMTVPTMWIQGIWDQEDMWGAIQTYQAIESKDTRNDLNYLVMGPWRHSGVNYEGSSLGPLKFEGDTALQFRRDVLKPFFDQYLRPGAPKADTPPVFIYNTGDNRWDRLPRWPLSCASGCPAASRPLYFTAGHGLSFTAPAAGTTGAAASFDEYVSDPSKPVPYLPRPVQFSNGALWQRWLLTDQRTVADRADVVSYLTPVLTEPVRISGAPLVNLVASTSGSDSDWVVKLIDVYPEEMPSQPEMGGYQLPVSMDIFRGRYRESFSTPKAVTPNTPLRYRFILPTANHVFQPGHRILVQVQSSWFPLYDRNPQTFVPNIFFAKPEDYIKATQRIYHAPGAASFIELPIVAARPSAQVPADNSADARLRALYTEEWSWRQKELGRGGAGSDRFAPVDAASQQARLAYWTQTLAALDAIPFDQLSAEEKINAQIFRTSLRELASDVLYRTYEAPFNSDTFFWTSFTPRQGFATADAYRSYLARLRDVPRYFDEQITNMRAGLARGYSVPRVSVIGRDQTIEPYVKADASNPLYAPFAQMPAGMPAADQAALRAEANTVIGEIVAPAYTKLLTMIRQEYLEKARRTLGAFEMPDGTKFYQAQIEKHTTLTLTPKEIHDIGLKEVARLEAEMRATKDKAGFKGTMAEFFRFMRTDPQFYAKTPRELLSYSAYVSKRADDKLAETIGFLPRRRHGIRPVPDAIAPIFTGGRGGLEACLMNTYNLPARPLYTLAALTLHECTPGHAFQAALALEGPERPAFRRGTSFSGYGEGWGLYVEWLGTVMGIYETPYEDMGRLTYEMWRACRLVIDTGIHQFGWTREQAMSYLRDRAPLAEHEITTEIDRYIAWPGQALAYKLGEIQIRRHRREAEEKLGPKFDQRRFHDAILAIGSVPLPVLEQRMTQFIADESAAATKQ